jgi:hypothetical protein
MRVNLKDIPKKAFLVASVWIVVAISVLVLYFEREEAPVKEFIAWALNIWQILALIFGSAVALSLWLWRHDFNPKTTKANSKYYEQNAEKAHTKHWGELVVLSEDVASKMSVPFGIDERYLISAKEIDKDQDGIRALMHISHWEDFDNRHSADYIDNAPKADWSLYSYLHTHLKAEDSEWEDKMSRLKDTAVNLHNKLYTLSEAAINITNHWQIILEADWVTDQAIRTEETSLKLGEQLKPMQKDIIQACHECREAIEPIQRKLCDKAKQRTFKGRCPACPDYLATNSCS